MEKRGCISAQHTSLYAILGQDTTQGSAQSCVEGGEEEEEKSDFQPPNLENGSGCRGKKFGHSSISMRSAPFRLRTPLRGAARAPQQPIVRLEPRLDSAHGTLDLLKVVVHGGETLSYASKEQYPERRVQLIERPSSAASPSPMAVMPPARVQGRP